METILIPRIFDETLKASLDSNLITVVLGPRQTGKTTSVNLLLKDILPNNKLTLNFDSSFTRDKVMADERYILDEIEAVLLQPFDRFKGRFFLFIDEAQKCPSSFEQIKILYDKYSPALKIVITGSSTLEMINRTAETLAGRIQTLRIFPFTISEAGMFMKFGNIDETKEFFTHIISGDISVDFINKIIKEKKPKSRQINTLIERCITRSLFPPTFTRITEEMVSVWLSDYIDTYIERDMRSVSEIGNITGFKKTVSLLAARTGSLLVINELANDSAISHITAKKYINIWQESLTGFLLPPFFVNTATRIKKSPKVYFIDNGLSWALTGYKDIALLSASGEIGNLFENLIITEFTKYAGIFPKKPQPFFWEKSQISEVDLIIQTQGLVIPIEIKRTSSFNEKILRGIDAFKMCHQSKGIKIPFSLVIYNGEFLMPRKDIFCIPAWMIG